ncbi:hypothetical protein BSKO_06876 [Bryopsis sp. KO-2023]|nr:hypothetical protein BSKO_06876 [Bryopsis sp. KO-2023]
MEPPSRQTAEWLDRLRGDMVPIVNNAQELIRRVFPYRSTKPGVSAFERIVLVAIRYHEEEENRENKTAQDLESEKSVVKTLHYLKNSNFHNAFLCCSLEIVAFAFLPIDVDDTDDDDDENYSNTFSCDCAQLMDEILFNNLFLIFGSSIPVLVACCVYGMTKAYNVHIGFLEIQESVFHIFPHVLRELMTKVEIGMEQDGTRQYGGICEFYNGVYLPSIRGKIQN